MRLLDAKTLDFVEFVREDETPKYAILSHTWEDDEVTFKDMRKYRPQAESKKGFRKIKHCADQAVKDGLGYFWIDTCCIDKSSSAELSEAINSMFRWYRNSEICYAFLSDIPFYPVGPHPDHEIELRQLEEIPKSRWFTRGWTLQELIAPRRVVFFSKEWLRLYDKVDLGYVIEERTKIPRHVLVHGDYRGKSIAQRMSWAAGRHTSRVEDMAYCLMGLFNINMPLLYGEGNKAFIRLQHEIIKESDDPSIFAWVDPTATPHTYRGLIASSVSHFATCHNVVWYTSEDCTYKITNKGIKINLPRWESRSLLPQDGFLAHLPGVSKKEGPKHPHIPLGIYITRIGDQHYARINPNSTAELLFNPIAKRDSGIQSPFYIRQTIILDELTGLSLFRSGGLQLRLSDEFTLIGCSTPGNLWDDEAKMVPFAKGASPVVTFRVRSEAAGSLDLTFDASRSWKPQILQISTSMDVYLSAPVTKHAIQFGLGGDVKSDPAVHVSIWRGLFGDRWLFRLDVVTRHKGPINRLRN